jgi:TPP-dependent pyruvate/acetoin dehydrogenase alpha subunit|tara:strand:+ start:479 stop:1087 length:609 start_codon:yes stop_codon:yes gene_type:complete
MSQIKKTDLIKFENKIIKLFNSSKIKSPIHLHSGNEKKLIETFKKIKKNDWVFSSWRSHYHCLLKGVPEKKLTQEIIKGKSISLCFPEHKIYSSAIVGGSMPIAVGVALSFKKKKSKNKVFVFIGEMTAETGIAHECIKYSINKKLPIHFVIEDNGKSVCTDTRKTWSMKKLSYENYKSKYVTYYKYFLKYPHAGTGKRIQF